MPKPATPEPELSTLKAQALQLLKAARDHGTTKLDATVEIEAMRVRYVIERTYVPQGEAEEMEGGVQVQDHRLEERIEIRVGPQSRPRTVFAAPAGWLEAAPN